MCSNPILRHHSPACHPQPPAPSPLFLKLQLCGFTILLGLVFLLMTPLLTQFCIHTHICAHIGIDENSYNIQTYIHIPTYTCMYIPYTDTQIHMHIILTCMYTHIHIYTYTCVHTFTHKCTHHTMYTDSYTHTSSFLWIQNSFSFK